MRLKMDNLKNIILEQNIFCNDCYIQQLGVKATTDDDTEQLKTCYACCEDCLSASNWQPTPGNKDFMIDFEDLVIGAILVSYCGDEHEIQEVIRKKCKPALLKIKTKLPIPEYIRVEDTIFYSLKG